MEPTSSSRSELEAARARSRERTIRYPLGSGQAEELAFAAGLKPMLRQLFPADVVASASARLAARGFAVRVARGAYVPEIDRLRYEPDDDAPGGMRAVFAGRDVATLDEAAELDVQRTDESMIALGRLLGYPRCCVEAFVGFPSPRENRDVFAAALARTHGSPMPRLNTLDLAVFHFVPWAPCSFRCALSAAYADRVASLVNRRFPAFVVAIDRALAAHRLMLDDDCQLSLQGPLADGLLTVERVVPTACHRHPDAALSAAAEQRVAELLLRVRPGSCVDARGGALRVDGADVPTARGALLVPFGG